MTATTNDAGDLIKRARVGDPAAEGSILDGQRNQLRRLIASRLDRRVLARIDPSDVVQEALADASRQLSAYLQDPPLPLLPWLCQFALERLAKLHRHHIRTSKRSVSRERPSPGSPSWEPTRGVSDLPVSRGTSPSGRVIRDETREQVRVAMGRLREGDRKILAMRHIEALSMAQIAQALDVSEGAAKVRHVRALRRLQSLLETP